MEGIATWDTKGVHMVPMRPYVDLSLVVGAEVYGRFKTTKHHEGSLRWLT